MYSKQVKFHLELRFLKVCFIACINMPWGSWNWLFKFYKYAWLNWLYIFSLYQFTDLWVVSFSGILLSSWVMGLILEVHFLLVFSLLDGTGWVYINFPLAIFVQDIIFDNLWVMRDSLQDFMGCLPFCCLSYMELFKFRNLWNKYIISPTCLLA